MVKKLFLILSLLVLTIGLAMTARPAAADGARHVYFNTEQVNLCYLNPPDERCNYGELRTLPNGKSFITGVVNYLLFTAGDPRWNAECKFMADPFPPSGHPVMGSFVCTPTDPAYAGGWWEGTTSQVFLTDKYVAEWHAKGYGIFNGLLAISRNTMSNHTYMVEIIELPGYQP